MWPRVADVKTTHLSSISLKVNEIQDCGQAPLGKPP
jgi:hypothetical protein